MIMYRGSWDHPRRPGMRYCTMWYSSRRALDKATTIRRNDCTFRVHTKDSAEIRSFSSKILPAGQEDSA